MAQSKNPALIFLDQNALFYWQAGLKTPVHMSFPKSAVHDLEVVDESSLAKSLQEFTNAHKILPTRLLIILSANVIFSKIIKSGEPSEEVIKQNFLDTVPFENVGSRLYPRSSDFILIAANKKFYETITAVFENLAFRVEAIIPQIVLPDKLDSFDASSTADCDKLLEMLNTLTPLSLIPSKKTLAFLSGMRAESSEEKRTTAERMWESIPKAQSENRKIAQITDHHSVNKNLRFLLPVFLISLILLGAMIFFLKARNRNTQVIAPIQPVLDSREQTVDDPGQLKIQIYHPPSNQITANTLKNALWTIGFKGADTKTTDTEATASASVKTTIAISKGIAEDLVTKLKLELDKFKIEYTTRHDNALENGTIIISLGTEKLSAKDSAN